MLADEEGSGGRPRADGLVPPLVAGLHVEGPHRVVEEGDIQTPIVGHRRTDCRREPVVVSPVPLELRPLKVNIEVAVFAAEVQTPLERQQRLRNRLERLGPTIHAGLRVEGGQLLCFEPGKRQIAFTGDRSRDPCLGLLAPGVLPSAPKARTVAPVAATTSALCHNRLVGSPTRSAVHLAVPDAASRATRRPLEATTTICPIGTGARRDGSGAVHAGVPSATDRAVTPASLSVVMSNVSVTSIASVPEAVNLLSPQWHERGRGWRRGRRNHRDDRSRGVASLCLPAASVAW